MLTGPGIWSLSAVWWNQWNSGSWQLLDDLNDKRDRVGHNTIP